jgi:hypothetical protein
MGRRRFRSLARRVRLPRIQLALDQCSGQSQQSRPARSAGLLTPNACRNFLRLGRSVRSSVEPARHATGHKEQRSEESNYQAAQNRRERQDHQQPQSGKRQTHGGQAQNQVHRPRTFLTTAANAAKSSAKNPAAPAPSASASSKAVTRMKIPKGSNRGASAKTRSIGNLSLARFYPG